MWLIDCNFISEISLRQLKQTSSPHFCKWLKYDYLDGVMEHLELRDIFKNISPECFLIFPCNCGTKKYILTLAKGYGMASAASWPPRVLFSQTSSPSCCCIIMSYGSLHLLIWPNYHPANSVSLREQTTGQAELYEKSTRPSGPGLRQPKPTITIYSDPAAPWLRSSKWELAPAHVR